MDKETWAKVKDIFSEVIALDPEVRDLRLDEICEGDSEVRSEVEALISSNDEVENFIEEPAFAIPDAIPPDIEPSANKQIGNYRIVREIGRGGMGTVFLATRDDGEFHQQVAIKIVSSAFLGRENLRRFRQERQILAELNHPNIARLLDGGVTDDGLPYLVMEYVEGEPLVEFAEKRSLTVDERLRVFQQICRAVAYAHAKLIVHRDIKPSNILVNAEGNIKLLDFGLAKFLDIESGDITATNFRALTPAYASPEQLRGDPITTASDIYSLGVVLYELLTGSRPFDHASMTFEKMIELVSGSEPEKPSAKVGSLADRREPVLDEKTVTERRRSLRGDIDNIVLMAMRHEPERRYGSVEQLANDIEGHLDGLPISATEDTFGYRASKFVRRHRIGIASVALVVLILFSGIVSTAWQARVAGRERDQAKLERDRAEQLNTFLQSILSAASPTEKGKNVKLIEVLDDAATRIDSELADQPELRARALTTIGRTYNELGIPDRAEAKLIEALNIYRGLFAGYNSDKVASMAYLADSLIAQYKFDEGESIVLEAISAERASTPGHTERLSHLLFIAGELRVRQGKYTEAESDLNESISICDEIVNPREADCSYYRISLGRAKRFAGDLKGAEIIFRDLLTKVKSESRDTKLSTADISVNLGEVLLVLGNNGEAIRFLTDADQVYQGQLGDSINLAVSRYYLSRAYMESKDFVKAAEFSRQAVNVARRISWVENRNFVGALTVLGLSLTRMGKAREGEPFLREGMSIAQKHLKADDTRLPESAIALAECLLERGGAREATEVLQKALAGQMALSNPNQGSLDDIRKTLALVSGTRDEN